MQTLRAIAALALSIVCLTGCGGGSDPEPKPSPTPTQSPVVRSDFVGGWAQDQQNVLVIRADGTFTHRECNTDGGTWKFHRANRSLELLYEANQALGCMTAQSDFPRAGTGAIRDGHLVLKDTDPLPQGPRPQYVLDRESP